MPDTHQTRPGGAGNRSLGGVVLLVASVIVILAGLKAAAPLLVPFLLAFFIVMIAGIPLSWMMRRGMNANLAAFVSIMLIGFVLLGISAIIGASMVDINSKLTHYEVRIQNLFNQELQWLGAQGLTITRQMISDMVNPAAIFSYVGNAFQTIARLFTDGVLIALVVVFMLFEAASIPVKLALIASGEAGMRPFSRFTEQMNKYLAVKTLISALTGMSVYVMLLILDVDFAVLWGFLAFLLNYIPNIGSLIAAIPVVLLTVIDKGFGSAMLVTGGFIVINTVLGNLLETRLLGRGLGLSTLVVFASLMFWGWLLGPVGALLSTPLTVVVKIGLETWDRTQWLAVLLSDHREIRTLIVAQEGSTGATAGKGTDPGAGKDPDAGKD